MPTFDLRHTHVVDALTAAGFSVIEAHLWAHQPGSELDPATVVACAADWRAHGFRDCDPMAWHRAGWDPATAAVWREHGFTAREATYVRSRLTAMLSDGSCASPEPDAPDDLASPAAWLQTDLTTDDIVLAVTAGCRTIRCAQQLTAECRTDPRRRGDIRLRAALDGIDLRALKDDR